MADYGAIGAAPREIVGADDDDDYYDADDILRELIMGDDDDDDDFDDDDDDDFDDEDDIGVDEIIGKRRRRRRRRARGRRRRLPRSVMRAAKRMRKLRAIDPDAVEVATQVDRRRRRLIMGSAETSIAASDTVAIELRPQRLFRTERVSIPSSVSANFVIEDVKIGQQSQFVATGVVHADTWSEVARDAYVHFDTADIGNTITIFVTNLDAANPHTFYSTWFGTATVR